jgi:hypothetical protein
MPNAPAIFLSLGLPRGSRLAQRSSSLERQEIVMQTVHRKTTWIMASVLTADLTIDVSEEARGAEDLLTVVTLRI